MKKVFLFVGIGLLLLAIPATVFFLGQQRDIRTRAAPATTLALTPSTQVVNVGSTVKLTVNMTPGPNQVVTADIYITYDPTKLTATSITNGANAPRVLNSGVIQNGTASIRVGAASNAQPITANGPIAVVTFTASHPTTAIAPAAVQFASNTFVGGINEIAANVLVGTTGAKITINGSDASQTAAATPTATPTQKQSSQNSLTSLLITPTLSASKSADASDSSSLAIQILTPTTNGSMGGQPVISGKAPAGTTVTLVIYSTPQTVIVTTDAAGNWTYTPTAPLDAGPHKIVASYQQGTGPTRTTNTSFVVVASAGRGGGTSSDSAMPVSGNTGMTLLLITIGIVFLTSGAVVWHF